MVLIEKNSEIKSYISFFPLSTSDCETVRGSPGLDVGARIMLAQRLLSEVVVQASPAMNGPHRFEGLLCEVIFANDFPMKIKTIRMPLCPVPIL